MKHILACDGGGIRGVFALQVVKRIEELLREHYGREDLVLADHFHFFAGTSTGAIIATCLCWGMSADAILAFYKGGARDMFTAASLGKRYVLALYDSLPLSKRLQSIFVEDGGALSTLGSEKLLRFLLVVTRNATTGSPWPLTNNPLAKYNDRNRLDCNLNIPLWQLVRASTAAPTYFPAETLSLGKDEDGKKLEFVFVDGGVTAYNNPALIAAQTAILPAYRMCWEAGPDKIRLVSIGTLRFASAAAEKTAEQLGWYHAATNVPNALMDTCSVQQDMVCRTMGKCLFGASIDGEIDTMITEADTLPKMFSYVRYNQSYKAKDILELQARYGKNITRLDSVDLMDALMEIGAEYANANVKIEHLI
jgi:patatin-like phospholipase/acyl hydrolase